MCSGYHNTCEREARDSEVQLVAADLFNNGKIKIDMPFNYTNKKTLQLKVPKNYTSSEPINKFSLHIQRKNLTPPKNSTLVILLTVEIHLNTLILPLMRSSVVTVS